MTYCQPVFSVVSRTGKFNVGNINTVVTINVFNVAVLALANSVYVRHSSIATIKRI